MNLAISSNSGTFCFDGSDKKMSDNGSDTGNFTRGLLGENQKLHYLFKTEMMGSKVPLIIKAGRAKLEFPSNQSGTELHNGRTDRHKWTSAQR